MANPNGLPLDLYLYQGKCTSIDSSLYPMPEKIDLGGRVVLKLVDTLPSKKKEEGLPETSSRKRRLVEPVPHVSKRIREARHLPICVKGSQNNRSKCRVKSCTQLTFVKCSTCQFFLCFNVNRNCFYDFHTSDNGSE